MPSDIINPSNPISNESYVGVCFSTPFAWFVALNNHCALHPHLEWRSLSAALFALMVFVISMLPIKEFAREE